MLTTYSSYKLELLRETRNECFIIFILTYFLCFKQIQKAPLFTYRSVIHLELLKQYKTSIRGIYAAPREILVTMIAPWLSYSDLRWANS